MAPVAAAPPPVNPAVQLAAQRSCTEFPLNGNSLPELRGVLGGKGIYAAKSYST